MNSNNFANFVKELRLEKKMSQNELAKALYVHRTTVNKWENGKVIPLNETLLVISDYFDVSVDELLNGKRNDADTDRTVTNNVLVSLLKSKTKFIRLFMISLVLIFLLIGLFLLYYFINTYNSLHVYRVFGDNGNIRFKDGLIITSNDKVYFKLGNFLYVDSENSISDIDYVSVYYYDKGIRVELFKVDYYELLIEWEKSKELFNKFLKLDEKLFMIVCFKDGKEEKIKLDYFEDFKNNSVINDDIDDTANYDIERLKYNNKKIINYLQNNNFEYDEEKNLYSLLDDGVLYTYYVDDKFLSLKNYANNEIIKIYLNERSLIYIYLKDNSYNAISFGYCKDKQNELFQNLYKKYFSRYFGEFLGCE